MGVFVIAIRDSSITLGEYLLVALDSDLDYLLDLNVDVFQNQFVFQTYAFSIENLLWHCERLEVICISAVNCSKSIKEGNIEKAIMGWSKAVYPMFLRFLKSGGKDVEILTRIIDAINIDELNFDYSSLYVPAFNDKEFEEKLRRKGVRETNIYLFVRGHNIEAQFKKLCEKLINAASDEVTSELIDVHGDAKAGQFISEFYNKRSTPSALVKSGHISCSICIPKIHGDIDAFNAKHTN